MIRFKNKKIYISPYTYTSRLLLETIEESCNIDFLGFIDKNKSGNNVYKQSDIIKDYDYILICSPNHHKSIEADLIKYKTLQIHYFNYQFYIKKIPLSAFLSKKFEWFYEYFYYKQFKINSLKNKHIGKRAFVLANGPSLNVNDIELIKDEITFAANKIWLLFNQTSWRPTYYTVSDRLVMKQNLKEIERVEANCKLFPEDMHKYTNQMINNSIYFKKKNLENSSFDLREGIETGPTVVYAMISFAIYMGIKEIYIIGLDHDFTVPKKYTDYKRGDDNVIISEGEVNHFHPDYRKKGEKWAQPEMKRLEEYFKYLNEYAQKNEIQIYNASRKTKLDIFKKVNFNDII